jgi:hypothetical protein
MGQAQKADFVGVEQMMNAKRLENETKLADSQARNIDADTENKQGGERDKLQAQTDEIRQNIENSKIDTQSRKQLNDSIQNLNNQKVQESIINTQLNQKDLEWMQKHNINRNDSIVAKTLKYLATTTGQSEENILYAIGSAYALKELIGLVPNALIKGASKGATKGAGKMNVQTSKNVEGNVTKWNFGSKN